MHNPPEASAPWCLFLCRGAEPRHTVIVLSVILSDQADSRRLLKIKRYKTSNISRTQYLLGSDLKNFGSKASFASCELFTSWTPTNRPVA